VALLFYYLGFCCLQLKRNKMIIDLRNIGNISRIGCHSPTRRLRSMGGFETTSRIYPGFLIGDLKHVQHQRPPKP